MVVTLSRLGRPTLRTSEFATWLHGQRNERSLEEVARLVRRAVAGAIAFDRSSWKKLEEGQLPNVIQLWGIAKALDVQFVDLARRVMQDLDVPVENPTVLRKDPPISAEAQRIARRYDKATADRRSAVRMILEGSPTQNTPAGEEAVLDQRSPAGRHRRR